MRKKSMAGGKGNQTILQISLSHETIAGGSPRVLKKKYSNRNYLQLFKGQANQQDLFQKQIPTKPENYYEAI